MAYRSTTFSSFSLVIQQKLGRKFFINHNRSRFLSIISINPSPTPTVKSVETINIFHRRNYLTMEESTTMTTAPAPGDTKNVPAPTESTMFPPIRKGMTVLDKSSFTKPINVPIIILSCENINIKLKALKPYFLKNRNFRPIIDGKDGPGMKSIYLNPDLVPDPKELITKFKDVLVHENEETSIYYETIEFTYENWTWNELFNSILPDDADKVGGFTIVGHLLHLNLRDHILPYKNIVGEILLDKLPNIKTVVNKTNSIDNTYRNFQMEVIAGEPNTIVKVKENGLEFEFDFATVYWNSRLSSEHGRVVEYLEKGQAILFDVFAGVGPFAIPAAKQKKCKVYANDLNPESYKWLNHNVSKRKVTELVKTFNKDGREFIRTDASSTLKSILLEETDPLPTFHFTMNLPAMAVEFLDSFWNLLNGIDKETTQDFTIFAHVYCFVHALEIEDGKSLALELVKENLCYDLTKENVVEIFFVRNVAPLKNMFRVTFKLPHEILFQPIPETYNNPSKKKAKLDLEIHS